MMNTISIAIHGGAGTLVKGMMTSELEAAYKKLWTLDILSYKMAEPLLML